MKRMAWFLLLLWMAATLSGCSVEKMDREKIREIEYTVVDKDEIPEEMKEQIEAAKEEPMTLSYGDKGYLYIARGYGAKETTGYSVEVKDCWESSNAVVLETNLLGPEKKEEILEKTTWPYLVIKMEYTDKQVVYE